MLLNKLSVLFWLWCHSKDSKEGFLFLILIFWCALGATFTSLTLILSNTSIWNLNLFMKITIFFHRYWNEMLWRSGKYFKNPWSKALWPYIFLKKHKFDQIFVLSSSVSFLFRIFVNIPNYIRYIWERKSNLEAWPTHLFKVCWCQKLWLKIVSNY